jgi:hypothetical protein
MEFLGSLRVLGQEGSTYLSRLRTLELIESEELVG